MSDIPQALNNSADAIAEQSKDYESCRFLSEDSNRIGKAGEFAFAQFCGIATDMANHPGGDGGIDGRVFLECTYDVKTADKPIWLFVEKGTVRADFYVLAGYDKATGEATCLGWEWAVVVELTPVKTSKAGIHNHQILQGNLRPMSELRERLLVLATDK